jgi:hypothetical protein
VHAKLSLAALPEKSAQSCISSSLTIKNRREMRLLEVYDSSATFFYGTLVGASFISYHFLVTSYIIPSKRLKFARNGLEWREKLTRNLMCLVGDKMKGILTVEKCGICGFEMKF